jgi:hypothetical protein
MSGVILRLTERQEKAHPMKDSKAETERRTIKTTF